ncbi:MAG: hypothetical protein VR65_04860 [Desulfobulbaceae bacterium BRH_c16a]|nr:MAG: hypothetical protein VR65_04275 [Desulfobulbaceae bacterium BRH_c16a]KJS02758.1 MAG: hypothetical protein VR65_04860 [Desulfobulbaceae bacterium BRH_c16a]
MNRMKCLLIHLIILLLLLPAGLSFSQTITGKVISVADGDTITILTSNKEQIKLRLSGVDTPEGGQAWGQKAKAFTSSMVKGKQVRVEPKTIDRYGRTVAIVFVNGKNLNEQIVAYGHGWVYRNYCKASYCDNWLKLEATARDAQVGLWADKSNITPPWEWRQQQRNSNNAASVRGGNKSYLTGNSGSYHGNIKSHVFHGSGCQHYNCKNCTVRFGSIQEAIGSGYHGHRDCVK